MRVPDIARIILNGRLKVSDEVPVVPESEVGEGDGFFVRVAFAGELEGSLPSGPTRSLIALGRAWAQKPLAVIWRKIGRISFGFPLRKALR